MMIRLAGIAARAAGDRSPRGGLRHGGTGDVPTLPRMIAQVGSASSPLVRPTGPFHHPGKRPETSANLCRVAGLRCREGPSPPSDALNRARIAQVCR